MKTRPLEALFAHFVGPNILAAPGAQPARNEEITPPNHTRRSFERTDRPVDALGRRAVFLPLFRHLVLVSLLAHAAHDEKVATTQQHLLNILRAYVGSQGSKWSMIV